MNQTCIQFSRKPQPGREEETGVGKMMKLPGCSLQGLDSDVTGGMVERGDTGEGERQWNCRSSECPQHRGH